MEVIQSQSNPKFSLYVERAKESKMGVIVVQEIYGVNAEVKRVVKQLAEWGFSAGAPDLFWRHAPNTVFAYEDRIPARDTIATLKGDDFVTDIVQAAKDLKQAVGVENVALLTLGWGGKFGLLAANAMNASAVTLFYPGNIEGSEALANQVKAPQLYIFAEKDSRTPPSVRLALRKNVLERDDVEIVVHRSVDHGFANRDRDEYDKNGADSADVLARDFLTRVAREASK
jgi:carboxymethylenebutenolidase